MFIENYIQTFNLSDMADYNNDTSWLLQNEDVDYISRSSNSSNVDLISLDYPEAAGCQVQGATDEELHWFEDFSYWTEGVVQLALGTSRFHFKIRNNKEACYTPD